MKTIIIKHWLCGNLVFMSIFNIMYFGSYLMNPKQPTLPYLDFFIMIVFISMTYTTIFTALDYLLIFKKRYKDFSRKDLK